MVVVDISNEEIKALDVVLDKTEVKPIVGFKLVSLRYRIGVALQKKIAKDKKKNEGK